MFDGKRGRIRTDGVKEEAAMEDSKTLSDNSSKASTQSPVKSSHSPHSPDISKGEEIVGGEVTLKMEPGQPPKLARSSSRKITSRPLQLFTDYENKTEEAKVVFEVIPTCAYSSRSMGATEHGMDCDCSEEWGKETAPLFWLPFFTLSNLLQQIATRRRMQLAARTRTASIAQPRSSAWAIAAADPTARINAFKSESTPR